MRLPAMQTKRNLAGGRRRRGKGDGGAAVGCVLQDRPFCGLRTTAQLPQRANLDRS